MVEPGVGLCAGHVAMKARFRFELLRGKSVDEMLTCFRDLFDRADGRNIAMLYMPTQPNPDAEPNPQGQPQPRMAYLTRDSSPDAVNFS